jgi:hypothetical protein
VRPDRLVAKPVVLHRKFLFDCRAHPFGDASGLCRLVVDVGVIAQVRADSAVLSVILRPSLMAKLSKFCISGGSLPS